MKFFTYGNLHALQKMRIVSWLKGLDPAIKRMIIMREKKSLLPTEKGLRVYELVKNMRISDIAMTGEYVYRLHK